MSDSEAAAEEVLGKQVISRDDAKVRGLKHYRTGKECKRGHIADRLVSNNDCVKCCRLRGAAWIQENQEEIKLKKSCYRHENKEKIIAYRSRPEIKAREKARYERNRDGIVKQRRRFTAEDKEKRQQAISSGLTKYFIDAPCAQGHIAERGTANNQCMECRSNFEKINPYRDVMYRRKIKFGISVEEQITLLSSQDNKCAICGCGPSNKRNQRNKTLALDHCHKGGGIRKFLCSACNVTIGYAEDDPKLLIAAAEYLQNHHPGIDK